MQSGLAVPELSGDVGVIVVSVEFLKTIAVVSELCFCEALRVNAEAGALEENVPQDWAPHRSLIHGIGQASLHGMHAIDDNSAHT